MIKRIELDFDFVAEIFHYDVSALTDSISMHVANQHLISDKEIEVMYCEETDKFFMEIDFNEKEFMRRKLVDGSVKLAFHILNHDGTFFYPIN